MEREKRTKGKSPESVEQSHGEGNGSRGHGVSMEVIFFPLPHLTCLALLGMVGRG